LSSVQASVSVKQPMLVRSVRRPRMPRSCCGVLSLQAELEAVRADYTDANPKIIDMRFELTVLDKALEKVYAVKPTETGKLTLALGKMLVKRASLETDVTRLLRNYTNDNTEVKRARRRVEIFDSAIKEILALAAGSTSS
jgi:hypothetical protein